MAPRPLSTHKTPAVHKWLLRHRRFHFHFTPTYGSWMNLVERWFSALTTKKLQRCAHDSVTAVTADIVESVEHWNENPTPFIWPKPTDEILGTAFLGAVVAKRAREFQDPSLKRRTRGDGPTDIRCRTATRLMTAAILNFLGTTR
ncbi:MAG: transposase [Rhodococcus sp. (in: high G+C Gram-positive bacteria)]